MADYVIAATKRPGQFPGIAGNYGSNRKFHKSDQTLNQTKRDINKLCLGKISLQKTVTMKLSVDTGFSNVFYSKYENPEMPEINKITF